MKANNRARTDLFGQVYYDVVHMNCHEFSHKSLNLHRVPLAVIGSFLLVKM